ncbi:MAG: hypothetical protein RIB46_01240 [Pseudomonadales bacterium]
MTIDRSEIYEVDLNEPAPDPKQPRPGVLSDDDALAVLKARREGKKTRGQALHEGHRRAEERAAEAEETERRVFDSVDDAYAAIHPDDPAVETTQLTHEQQAAADAKRARSDALQREATEGPEADIPIRPDGTPDYSDSDRATLAQLQSDAQVFHRKLQSFQQLAARIQAAGSVEALVGNEGDAQSLKLQLAHVVRELQAEKARLTAAGQKVAEIENRARLQQARAELYKAAPALRDPGERAKLRSWLVDVKGYSPDEVSSVTDPRLVALAWQSYLAENPRMSKAQARGKLRQAADKLRLQQAPPRQGRGQNGRFEPVEASRRRAEINRRPAKARDEYNEAYWKRTGISARDAARGGSLTGALRLLEKRRNQGRTRAKS